MYPNAFKSARFGTLLALAAMLATFLTTVVTSTPARAANTLTFAASADAWADWANPSSTAGGTDTHLYTDGTSGAERKSVLKFAVSGIPVGGTITSATLKMYVNVAPAASTNVALKNVTSTSWTESTVSGSHFPATSSPTPIDVEPVSAPGWKTMNALAGVSGNGTFSLALMQGPAGLVDWSSREGANPPQLVVTWLPWQNVKSPLTLTPADDAYVAQDARTTNFGSSQTLLSDDTTNSIKRTWLKFTVPPLPAGSTVTNATVTMTNTLSNGATAYLKPSADTTWQEGAITWGNAPAFSTTAIAKGSPAPTAVGPVTFNATSVVTQSGTYSFLVMQPDAVETRWASKEAAVGAPTLKVTFTLPTSTTIAVAGDIACDPTDSDFNAGSGTPVTCQQAATAAVINGMSPDRVLTLGDNQYECGGLQAYLQSYDLSWGAFKSKTSPVVGNHEHDTSGGTNCDSTARAAGYRTYFQGSLSPPPTDPNEGLWYETDLTRYWHLIVLDSDCFDGLLPCAKYGTQEAWFKRALAGAAGQHIVVAFHHPRFSDGSHGDLGSEDIWWTDMMNANRLSGADVELVLNGHEHNYQLFDQIDENGNADTTTGIRELICGTGGREHVPAGVPSDAHAALVQADYTHFGVCRLTLQQNSYDLAFSPIAGQTGPATKTYSTKVSF